MKRMTFLSMVAAALVVVAVTTPADAQVVYSGPDRNVVYAQKINPSTISLFDAPGTWDDLFLLRLAQIFSTLEYTCVFMALLPTHGHHVRFAVGSDPRAIRRFAQGNAIGSAETYGINEYQWFSRYFSNHGGEYGEYRNQTGYAGILMVDGEDHYYGWIQVSVTNYNTADITGTLIDWAYNSVPGRPILAGSLLDVDPLKGPLAGGNPVELNDAGLPLGDGGDITHVLVGGVSAQIVSQDVHAVAFMAPPGVAPGPVDVVIQSASLGDTEYLMAYTYNPAGEIGWTEYGPTIWTNLAEGLNNGVQALAWDGERLYAGGAFTEAGGVFASYVAAWNGTSWSSLGGGLNGGGWSLAHDGVNLYAGGFFTEAGGVAANNVAMWDGTDWTNLGNGLDGGVVALAHDGTHLFAGCNDGVVAMWDGAGWTHFPGIVSTVWGLLHTGGDLYAGSSQSGYALRWDGSGWVNVGAGMESQVNALVQDGTNLYAGGWFTGAGEVAANGVGMWNGVSWTNLGDGVMGSFGPVVLALAHDGTTLHAGGLFTNAGGMAAESVAAWDGSTWTNLGSGLNGVVQALADDGLNLYAGGVFTHSGGHTVSNVAKWGPEVIEWPGVSPEIGLAAGGYEVVISGSNLGDGGDITNVTLVGASVAGIISQSSTQVVVVAGGGDPGLGDVRVFSTSFGETVKSNAFEYRLNAPIQYDPVNITPSNLVARWQPVPEANTHFLEVGLDTNFVQHLDGYEQREVFGVGQYMVTGLTDGVWYAIRLFASKDGGMSDPSRTVWVPAGSNTPYEEHPPLSGPISEGAISEFDLSHIFHGAGLIYDVESSDEGVMVAAITGDGYLRLEPVGPGTATITVTATDPVTEYTTTYSFAVTVVGDPAEEANYFRPREPWNPRFEQVLELRNDSGVDAIGVRVLFSDLRSGITVENQTGVSWDGRPMIEMETPFNDGDTLELVIVYVCTGAFRVDEHPPTIEMQYILPAWRPPLPGVGVAVDIKAVLPDGWIVLEFDTVPGALYAIEYMNNFPGGGWVEVPLRIRAGANRTQWIDSGPPATLPMEDVRMYRIKQLLE